MFKKDSVKKTEHLEVQGMDHTDHSLVGMGASGADPSRGQYTLEETTPFAG